MPQILVEDDIAFEIVEDEDAEKFYLGDEEGTSEGESERPKGEMKVIESATPTARPLVKVEVTEEPEEEEAESEVEEPAAEVEVPDADLVAFEAELDQWIESEKEAAREEGSRQTQAVKDKEIGRLLKKLETFESREDKLLRQLEEAKTEGLTEDERTLYLDARNIDQQRKEVMQLIEEHDAVLKTQLVSQLVEEYGQYGVSVEDLEDLDEPEDMERICERAELKFLRENRNKPVVVAPEVAKPIPARINAKPVPAGASAPADLGGAAPALTTSRRGKVADGTGIEAAAETLRNLPYQTVRL